MVRIMPNLIGIKCNRCDFQKRSFQGHNYVINDSNKRIVCAHPGESYKIAEVLKIPEEKIIDYPWLPLRDSEMINLIKQRTGFNSDLICLNCLKEFSLDLQKDEIKYGKNNSLNVSEVIELDRKSCPKCSEGILQKYDTAIIS